MLNIPIEHLLKETNNRYRLVILAAKRTRQLLNGKHPLVETLAGEKLTMVALREILEGKITYQDGIKN